MTTIETLGPGGITVESTTFDMHTMNVLDHTGPGLEWDEAMDGCRESYDVFTKEVFSTDAGLKYKIGIRVLNLSACTGENKTIWTVEEADKNFDSEEEAEKYITELKDSAVTFEAIESYELDEYVVEVVVVPVSISRKRMEEIIGDDAHILDAALDCEKAHGDFRDMVWDISNYGIYIQCWSESIDGIPDSWPLELIEEAKKQAIPIPSMFGRYMERPQNKAGWDGWYILKRAGAYVTQHDTKKSKTEVQATVCDDCGEERECGTYNTTYSGGTEVPICEDCLNTDWIVCTRCRILIPIQAQGHWGVDWIELRQEKHCRDCASDVLDAPDNDFSIRGGNTIAPAAFKGMALNLVGVSLGEWEETRSWDINIDSTEQASLLIAAEVSKIIEEARYDDEFLLGVSNREQFGFTLSLHQRYSKTLHDQKD